LTRQIEIAGKSGARYRYTALEEERILPASGANFIIAQVTQEGPSILFAGETDNLSRAAWREPLARAQEAYGEVNVLMRLNVTRAIRRAEQDDVVEEHHPPLNQAQA
jgi:hypothetical protein